MLRIRWVLSVLCMWGTGVVTNLLFFFLGVLLYRGAGWVDGTTLGIS
jgi:hypothetical protein